MKRHSHGIVSSTRYTMNDYLRDKEHEQEEQERKRQKKEDRQKQRLELRRVEEEQRRNQRYCGESPSDCHNSLDLKDDDNDCDDIGNDDVGNGDNDNDNDGSDGGGENHQRSTDRDETRQPLSTTNCSEAPNQDSPMVDGHDSKSRNEYASNGESRKETHDDAETCFQELPVIANGVVSVVHGATEVPEIRRDNGAVAKNSSRTTSSASTSSSASSSSSHSSGSSKGSTKSKGSTQQDKTNGNDKTNGKTSPQMSPDEPDKPIHSDKQIDFGTPSRPVVGQSWNDFDPVESVDSVLVDEIYRRSPPSPEGDVDLFDDDDLDEICIS